MGMFDFLKKDDEAEDGYDEDEEAYSSKRKKNDRGSSVRSIPAEESENADRMAGEAGSRFSTDYRSYLKMQSEQAKENLRKRTEAARAMVTPLRHSADGRSIGDLINGYQFLLILVLALP